ncbi:MAG: type II toxin-antitoxin system VapC family toxin, partial [Acidobacteria bacterium]|nr:type II toxin-antitoxin system VapC family toxin [Acidobacteriota bacterium]
PAIYVPERRRVSGVRELPITHAHALAVGVLPPHHRDPFDRVLVAQARIEGLTLVTADSMYAHYDVRLIRV